MNLTNKNKLIEAINNGINLINTSGFYHQGESELVVGEELYDIPRYKHFISVNFDEL